MLEKVVELIWAPWMEFHIFIMVVRINNFKFPVIGEGGKSGGS